MKKLYYFSIILLSICMVLISCKEEEETPIQLSSDASIKSVIAYAEHPGRGQDILDISFSVDCKIITFTTRALPIGEDPVDMTKVKISMVVAEKATVDLRDDYYDLTKEGNKVTVTAEDGTTHTALLVGEVTPPYEVIPEYKITVTEEWSKSGEELQLKCPQSLFGIAVANNMLLIMDNGLDHNPDTYKIKAYDKMNGSYIGDVSVYEGGWWGVPAYMGAIASDDVGNFGNMRLDETRQGTWMDRYTSLNNYNYFMPIRNDLFRFAKRLQFLGDITGTGKVIATNGTVFGGDMIDAQYCVWSVNGGVIGEPSIVNFGNDLKWRSAFVQQASLDNPLLYVSYNTEPNYPNDPPAEWKNVRGAHFVVFDPSSGLPEKEIAQENFLYRILDHQVFKLGDLILLFTLEQGYSTGTSPMVAKLFNITFESRFDMKPNDEEYDKFKIFESDEVVIENDLRRGNVTAWVDDTSQVAYLVAFFPASPTTINPNMKPIVTDAKIVVYKVEAEKID